MKIKIANEIKEETNCIYKIVNKVNGNVYLGSTTVGADERINEQHVKELDRNEHGNNHLQNAWNLYGKQNFYGEVVKYLPCLTQKEVLECEQDELDKIFSLPVKERVQKYYNINRLATGCSMPVSEETKQKLSEAGKKRFEKPEERKKQRKALIKHYKEHSVSDKTRQKLCEANLGDNNPMWGKHHANSTIQKMSEANTGEKCYRSLLTNAQANEIREKHDAGKTIKDLAIEYNVSYRVVWSVVNGLTYKQVTTSAF